MIRNDFKMFVRKIILRIKDFEKWVIENDGDLTEKDITEEADGE